MTVLDGKSYSDELIEKFKRQTKNNDIILCIISSSNSKSSKSYIKSKIKACEKLNIKIRKYEINNEKQLSNLIKELNQDKAITGIFLDSYISNFNEMINLISKDKDVEGLTKDNIYDLYIGKERVIPCTAKGIIKLLEKYDIDIEGQNVVIIGRGITTGKPLAQALINRNATVTLCHSKTKNLKDITKKADILISMVGKSGFITKDMVKYNFIGIDAGISKENGRIVGDFNYNELKEKASYITKVPGGVGPMTTAMLIENLINLK